MVLFVTLAFISLAIGSTSAGFSTNCRPGWIYYGGSCYAFGDVARSWWDAAAICKENEGYLIEINTESENRWLVTRLSSSNFGSVWTGGNEILHRGTLVWSKSGRVITYSDWSGGQPSDPANTIEDCVEVRAPFGYKWNDYQCEIGNRYVCEASPLPN